MRSVGGIRKFQKAVGADMRPDSVILIGLGFGAEVPVIRDLWPEARVIAAEPIEENVKRWERALKLDPKRRLDVLERVAVMDEPGNVMMWLGYEPDQRASICQIVGGLPGEESREVDAVTLNQFARATQPWGSALLWLDAEGAEAKILEGGEWAMRAVHWVNVEITWMSGRRYHWTTPARVDELLEKYGFRQMAVHTVHRSGMAADAVYVRKDVWLRRQQEEADRAKRRKTERRDDRTRRVEERKAAK